MLHTRELTSDTHRMKVRGWKKVCHASGNDKKAILIWDKIDFKTKIITKEKEGCYIMIKESIQEEDIILVNKYAPNTGAPKYMKQILTDIKGEIDNYTIIAEDFITWFIAMDRSSRDPLQT